MSRTIASLVVEVKYGDVVTATAKLEGMGKAAKHTESLLSSLSSSFRNGRGALGIFSSALSSTLNVLKGVGNIISSVAGHVMAAFTAFTHINSKIEQYKILLLTVTGSTREASRAFSYLTDMTTKTPFSIDTLTDAFVKFKSAGLQDTEKHIRILSDSVSAFGGTSENFKLVSLAITQMVGKGVVSMEELRRQLSEQIPTAIPAMAAGLGVSISKMYAMVKSGSLDSVKAIEAMNRKFEEWYGGASQARMDSYSGALARMKNEWILFMVDLGEGNGMFNSLTATVNRITDAFNKFRTSVEGARIVDEFTDNINNLLDSIAANPNAIKNLFEGVGEKISSATGPLKVMYGLLTKTAYLIDRPWTVKVSGLKGEINEDNYYSYDIAKNRKKLVETQRQRAQMGSSVLETGKHMAQDIFGAFGGNDAILKRKEEINKLDKEIKVLQEKIDADIIKANADMAGVSINRVVKTEAEKAAADVEKAAANAKKEVRKLADSLRIEAKDAVFGVEEEVAQLNPNYGVEQKYKKLISDLNVAKGTEPEEWYNEKLAAINKWRDSQDKTSAAAAKSRSNEYLKLQKDIDNYRRSQAELQVDIANSVIDAENTLLEAVMSDSEKRVNAINKEYDAYEKLLGVMIEAGSTEADTQEEIDRIRDKLSANKNAQLVEEAKKNLDEIGSKGEETASTLKDAFSGWASNLSSDLNDLVWDANASFGDILESFAKMITQMIIQIRIVEPLLNSVFKNDGVWDTVASSIGSWFGSGVASGTMSTTAAYNNTSSAWDASRFSLTGGYAKGGVFSTPGLAAYENSVVSRPTIFPFARGVGLMGENGAEAIVPLTRTNNGDLGVKAIGGGNVTVNVVNNSANSAAATSERSDGRGNRVIDVIIDQIKSAIAGDITSGNGAVPTALGSTYGLNRTAGAY